MPGKVGHYHLLTFVKEKLLETRVFSRRYSKHKSCLEVVANAKKI
jgi:hypothetical protein